MKTSTTIATIIVILLVAAGIYLFAHKNNTSTNTTNQTTAGTSTDTSGTSTGTTSDNTSPTDNTTPPPATTASAALSTGTNATLGTYLTAANGMTLYMYTKDTPGVSNCSGTCATQWPPYTVTTTANLTGITGLTGNIGTIARADGTTQVTYNNKPLYFWYKDAKVGDTTGQNVGGVWFVVKP